MKNLSEKQIQKVIYFMGEIYEKFTTINQYGDEGDTDSDGYESAREGLDLLIEKNEKLYEAKGSKLR